jgi:putative transposase
MLPNGCPINGSALYRQEHARHSDGLRSALCFTLDRSPESNGIAEAFVKLFKRDYTRLSILPDAATVIARLPARFEDYNKNEAARYAPCRH